MDLSTLVEKVRVGELDLQPDFQRGQVWADSKKRRLIDTILRQWYVPSVHIVVNDELDREEVLDGQQRLRAVIDFMSDKFPIDGKIDPYDEEISSLHGLYFSQLPDRIKSRFRRFPITTVRLRDYEPQEPGELFFRLNQLTSLTAAEQRNALVGHPRNQVRELVELFEESSRGASIGFSNARMNFDDTIARLAITLEFGSLQAKISAATLERRYRDGSPFQNRLINRIRDSIELLSAFLKMGNNNKLNKASLFSWMYFSSHYEISRTKEESAEFYRQFEAIRSGEHSIFSISAGINAVSFNSTALYQAATIFNDRASSRVNDVSSVTLRDMCLSVCFTMLQTQAAAQLPKLADRSAYIATSIARLRSLPTDVAERSLAESALAKQWEERRAPS